MTHREKLRTSMVKQAEAGKSPGFWSKWFAQGVKPIRQAFKGNFAAAGKAALHNFGTSMNAVNNVFDPNAMFFPSRFKLPDNPASKIKS